MSNEYLEISLVFIFFVILILGIFYMGIPRYNQKCLKDYARVYCSNNNLDFYANFGTYFSCSGSFGDARTGIQTTHQNFNYLQSEKDSCLTKKAWSFKKIK